MLLLLRWHYSTQARMRAPRDSARYNLVDAVALFFGNVGDAAGGRRGLFKQPKPERGDMRLDLGCMPSVASLTP